MQQVLLYTSLLRQPGGWLSGKSHPFLMCPSRASHRGPTDVQVCHTLGNKHRC